jgi:hypothetical protein
VNESTGLGQCHDCAELYAALSKAQGEFTVAHRSKANPFFKSRYADFESVVNACRPALAKYGLAFLQLTKINESGTDLVTRITHSSGQWIEGEYPIKVQKDDPQGWGSAITYSRRYALAAALGVVASDEDDDAERASDHPEIDDSRVEKCIKFLKGKAITESEIKTAIQVDSLENLSKSKRLELIEFASNLAKGPKK